MIWGASLLAAALWAFTFGLPWGNFWFKIGLSVLIVVLYSLIWQKPKISFRLSSFFLGAISAAVLYGIFLLGNLLASQLFVESSTQVGRIYALGEGSSRVWVFFLLLLVTGPGEEIFWRGFLQSQLMQRWGNPSGVLAATVLYAGVHLFSWNFILTLAALVAGAFWGALYLWRRDLSIQITSHSLWSAFIFAVAPVS